MCSIAGIGAAVYDTLIVTDRYPTEDTKLRAKTIQNAGGGPCATGLVAAAKLGADCAYLGVLSADTGGRFLLEDFRRYGVDTARVRILEGAAALSSFVLLSEAAQTRTCVIFRGDLPPLSLDGAQKSALRNTSLLMVDGNELSAAVEGAAIVRRAGGKVLYDAGGLYEGIDALLKLTDFLIPSEEFALAYTGEKTAKEAAKRLFDRYAPEVVVITRGKEGGVCYDGKEYGEYPAFPVKAVDSNGAGDVFHGAFAFAQTKGMDSFKSCVFASAAAALKCTRLGARKGAPGYGEVVDFLRRNGYER